MFEPHLTSYWGSEWGLVFWKFKGRPEPKRINAKKAWKVRGKTNRKRRK